ncbi:hypothetical protein G2W53_036388 [Senna tora]|uniref:Uncharacterized protein n=1 Tax=Senna tora TaxID=362788 RepID=A0A834W4R8_9FABA|nr:hypothetical protein G2W53_036388 [Senna tora]
MKLQLGMGSECDDVVRRGTGEGACTIVISVAVSAWARALEELRVTARFARVRSRVSPTAAILRISKRFTRAFTRHALSPVAGRRHLQLRRASSVQIHNASRRRAVPRPRPALRLHRHRKVIAIDEANVVEIESTGAVQCELRESRRRSGAATGAFDGGGAAVAGEAGEFSGGVLGAESPAPEAAGPGGRELEGVGFAGLEGEAGGGELWSASAGQNAWPYCVAALVDDCECGRIGK